MVSIGGSSGRGVGARDAAALKTLPIVGGVFGAGVLGGGLGLFHFFRWILPMIAFLVILG
jgi:hypothetical protein